MYDEDLREDLDKFLWEFKIQNFLIIVLVIFLFRIVTGKINFRKLLFESSKINENLCKSSWEETHQVEVAKKGEKVQFHERNLGVL